MGHIIKSKIQQDQKVIYQIELDEEESLKLQGHLKKVYVFTSNLCNIKTQINSRGNKGVTKYFRIPLEIRPRKKQNGVLASQRIESSSKVFYIYTITKTIEDKK